MTLTEVYTLIRAAIQTAGSQKAFAQQAGVSPQFMCDVVNCRSDPSDKVLAAAGVRKVTTFEMID